MSKKLLSSLLLIVITVTFVHAQSFSIGPNLGFFKAKGADEGKFWIGGTARLKLSSNLGVEGSINYRQEEYKTANGTMKVTSIPIMVTGLFYPLPLLYGAAGAGWYNSKAEFQGSEETNQDFGYHFGGGIELNLGSITLSADIKYVFINYKFEGVPGKDDDYNFYVITGSLLFNL
ncbi:MAG: porin family protein [Ignavibacteria bacterium]|nr:porin family protein [Ignavibacteria bacterium]